MGEIHWRYPTAVAEAEYRGCQMGIFERREGRRRVYWAAVYARPAQRFADGPLRRTLAEAQADAVRLAELLAAAGEEGGGDG